MIRDALVCQLKLGRVKGQAAGIRFFDEDSKSDYQALMEIMSQAEVKKWMDESGKISMSDYKEWAGKHNDESFLFAVHDLRRITVDGIKKIRGFVSIYSERSEKYRVKRMIKNGVFAKEYLESAVLEASMAGGTSSSGLMSSAMRQACLEVKFVLSSLSDKKVKIVAYVDPENVPSVRATEAAGFRKIGRALYDPDSESESDVYDLDWELLEEIINRPSSIKVIPEPQITDSHCGPATTKALLRAGGVEVTQDQVIEAAGVKRRLKKHGMRVSHIAKAVKKLAPNLRLWFKENSDFSDLNQLVNKLKFGVGVNWQGLFYDTVEEEKRESPNDDHGHYSIVVGVKTRSKQLLIDDPYADYFHCPRMVPYSWFVRRWWDSDIVREDRVDTRNLLFVVAAADCDPLTKLGMRVFE